MEGHLALLLFGDDHTHEQHHHWLVRKTPVFPWCKTSLQGYSFHDCHQAWERAENILSPAAAVSQTMIRSAVHFPVSRAPRSQGKAGQGNRGWQVALEYGKGGSIPDPDSHGTARADGTG